MFMMLAILFISLRSVLVSASSYFSFCRELTFVRGFFASYSSNFCGIWLRRSWFSRRGSLLSFSESSSFSTNITLEGSE